MSASPPSSAPVPPGDELEDGERTRASKRSSSTIPPEIPPEDSAVRQTRSTEMNAELPAPGAPPVPGPGKDATAGLADLLEPEGGEMPIDLGDLDSLEELEINPSVGLMERPALAEYGNYELLGRIAHGGMAEIFLAREAAHVGTNTQRLMVVKRVLPNVAEDPQFVTMFLDEARLAMQLNHPNICHVYGFGEEGGTYYLAMEWINGMPLSKVVRRARYEGKKLPIELAVRVIAQVAEALDHAHRATDNATGEPLGIVHRDVSPQNIMVAYNGVVKLLDFGIAKATTHSTKTEAGVVKGKFAYMSPQQCMGEPIDGRADLFALGVCLFEAIAGKNPFKHKSEFKTMTTIVQQTAPDIREYREEVPEALALVIKKALERKPERRYQSAGEMQLALEEALTKMGLVVNSGKIADFMGDLFADTIKLGPKLDTRSSIPKGKGTHSGTESVVQEDRPLPSNATDKMSLVGPLPSDPPSDMLPLPPSEQAPREEPRRSLLFPILGLLGLLIGLGVAGWALTRGGPGETTAAAGAGEGGGSGAPATPEPGEQSADPAAQADPAPQAGAAAQETGSVLITSQPRGASIDFGERGASGQTPVEIGMLQPGSYHVTLSLDGYREWEGDVEIHAGVRAIVEAELSRRRAAARPRGAGTLSLNTRPWSKVYVGRRLLGTTPIGGASVPAGTLRLRLVDRDGNTHRRSVRIQNGETTRQFYDLSN